jgi:hypothetical protein
MIGIEPKYLDFTSPELASFKATEEMVRHGVAASRQEIADAGYIAESIWIDLGETAVEVVAAELNRVAYDYVLIGAGIRVPPSNFLLFDQHLSEFFWINHFLWSFQLLLLLNFA